MKREKRKCISTLLFQKGERHFDQMIDLVCHEKLSYKEKKESHYISNSRMAGFSHFLPNELFTDSAEGHLHSIYTWAMLPTRVCSFMRLFPEFYIFSSFILWKQWCAPPQRGMEIQSPYICPSVITEQPGGVIFCKEAIIRSMKIDRKDNSGPRRKSSCNWQSWLSLLSSVSASPADIS